MQDSSEHERNRTMEAAVIAAPKRVEVIRRPVPVPNPAQVRVWMQGCGVCASNVPVWEGRPWFEYPLDAGAPGHEGWGIIDAVGATVRHLQPGQRVAMLSQKAFAEYDIADANAVVPLPDALAEQPFLGEPLGCAVNIFRRSQIESGQTVAIIGTGFLGSLLAQLASAAGAEVIAVSRRSSSLQTARESGARHLVAFTNVQDVDRQVRGIVGDDGCERVIEATGTQVGLDCATAIVGTYARLIIAGYHQTGMRQVNMQVWNWRGIDVINAHERDANVYIRGIEAAVDAASNGRLNALPLLSHEFGLSDLGKALECTAERPEGFCKAYVSMARGRGPDSQAR